MSTPTPTNAKVLHQWKTWITFGDTDPAGRIYFARLFEIAHRAVEDYAVRNHLFAKWFGNDDWATPVRHAEADFLAVLKPGDEVTVKLFSHKVGRTSFTWLYEIYQGETLAGTVKITHVTVDKKTGSTRPVPAELVEFLSHADA